MNPSLPLSVCIIARNEERNITECLASVAFASQIIVIDDFSSDRTAQLARDAGAEVYQRALNGDWGGQQTFAIEKASHDWVLLLDCDERITPELAEEISACVRAAVPAKYSIQRLNHFQKQRVRFGTLRPDRVVRLMPRSGTSVTGFVHPQIISPYPEKKLESAMLHYTYESWDAYYRKLEQYSRLAALKYHEEGRQSFFLFDILVRPFFAFLKMYIFQLGMLDGRIGLALGTNHAFYTLSKYLRLYQLNRDSGQ